MIRVPAVWKKAVGGWGGGGTTPGRRRLSAFVRPAAPLTGGSLSVSKCARPFVRCQRRAPPASCSEDCFGGAVLREAGPGSIVIEPTRLVQVAKSVDRRRGSWELEHHAFAFVAIRGLL